MTPLERGRDLSTRVLAKKTTTETLISTLQLLPFAEGVVKELRTWVDKWQKLGRDTKLCSCHVLERPVCDN